nr:hypothetical protein [Tanacetum cinerariifolium]
VAQAAEHVQIEQVAVVGRAASLHELAHQQALAVEDAEQLAHVAELVQVLPAEDVLVTHQLLQIVQ